MEPHETPITKANPTSPVPKQVNVTSFAREKETEMAEIFDFEFFFFLLREPKLSFDRKDNYNNNKHSSFIFIASEKFPCSFLVQLSLCPDEFRGSS